MYNLPKGYLSYSQFHLWETNKNAYRERYYLGKAPPETVETIFGKRFAKSLEDNDPSLAWVPRLEKSEYAFEYDLEGVRIKGYIDSFSFTDTSFYEYKTGHVAWDRLLVRKHKQLPFYALAIEKIHGKVQRKCSLFWFETRFREKSMEFQGHILTAQTRELELTGRMERFDRIIYKWEREKMKKDIIRVAKEISDDYTKYTERSI